MRILFITSNSLGDAVLSTGLLDHLIRTQPNARITVVCGPVPQGIFTRMPNRDKTIVLRKRPQGRHWLPLWAATVTIRWDLVVDIRASALAWLLPTRKRAIFRRTGGHKINQLAAVLKLSPPPMPVAWIDPMDRQNIAERLPPNRPIVVLAPTANWNPKVWPPDRFADAFRQIARPNSIAVVLGGPGSAERSLAMPLLQALPDAIDLVGQLTLPQVSACLERASLFIGNDSGLMHMAAAAGAPTIGLFGPTDATTYSPAGRCTLAVTGPSMAAITVQQVVNAAHRLLDQAPTIDSNASSDSATARPAVSN